MPAGVALLTLVAASERTLAQEGFGDRKVVDLRFEGNREIDDYTLRRSISTSNSSLGSRLGLPIGVERIFDETEFRRDVLRLILFYRQAGFLDVNVDTILERTDKEIRVRFLIDEGDPVRVSNLTIEGTDVVEGADRLRRRLPIGVGRRFDRFDLQAATDTITALFQNRGYALVDVFRSFQVDRRSRTAQIEFVVVPGPVTTVGRVTLLGNERISDGLIMRSLAVRPGAVFRRSDLFDSQRSLYALDVFSFVDVGIDSASIERRDSVVDISVRVSEGRMTTLRAGFGFGTVDCFRTLGGVRLNNFLGDARALDLTLRFSKIGAQGLNQSVCGQLGNETSPERLDLNHVATVSLRIPSLFSRNTRAVLTLSQEKSSQFLAFLREAAGANLALTRSFGRSVTGTFTYDLSFGSTKAGDATFCSFLNVCRQEDIAPFQRDLLRSTLGVSLALDRSNSVINPSKGWRLLGEIRWASPVIGSDSLARFTKLLGELTAYTRVGRTGLVAFRLRSGTILSSRLSVAAQSVRFIPIEERFFAGGPNSVRGFGQNELGPIVRVIRTRVSDSTREDTTISATGGNSLLVANLEYRFLLPGFGRRLSSALFVDAGQVFERDAGELLKVSGVKFTPGIGFRYATPIGPVRVDVAYNPYDPENGPVFREEGTELVPVPGALPPPGSSSFFGRLKLNIAIGQAF